MDFFLYQCLNSAQIFLSRQLSLQPAGGGMAGI
jgi:hypothetical protein